VLVYDFASVLVNVLVYDFVKVLVFVPWRDSVPSGDVKERDASEGEVAERDVSEGSVKDWDVSERLGDTDLELPRDISVLERVYMDVSVYDDGSVSACFFLTSLPLERSVEASLYESVYDDRDWLRERFDLV